MADRLYTLEYVSKFRTSDENALAFIRKYFASDFWLRFLVCIVRGVGVVLAALLVVWIADQFFDMRSGSRDVGLIYAVGLYCGFAAFLANMVVSYALLPFCRNMLYRQFATMVPDERVRLELSSESLSWISNSMNLEVPLGSIVAVQMTPAGVTIGVGGAWSRFIPLAAFTNSSELIAFLRHLKLHLNAEAQSRSAAAFRDVEA